MMKLLLIEDEKRMAQALSELLCREGYETDCFYDGDEGLFAAENGSYDGILLDVMLPGIDGFEIIRRLRAGGNTTPVLMLTARSELSDKVMGLDGGADDYLTKPFVTEELLARVRALCRRTGSCAADNLSFGDISLIPASLTLCCNRTGQSVRVSDKEFRILEYMVKNRGRILTREQLALKIWGYDCEAEYNNVEVYMSFTRKKLAFAGSKTEIKSVRGVGYELRWEDV